MSRKSESATCQWLGAAITMKQHIKIQPFLVDLVKDWIGKMQDHQECVEMSFMDKLQDHYRYMLNIRGCSESLQNVRLASIAASVDIGAFSLEFREFQILEFLVLQARSLQIIAHKFSYDLCKQSSHLSLSSSRS